MASWSYTTVALKPGDDTTQRTSYTHHARHPSCMISLQLTFAAAVNPLSADADFQGLMGLDDLPGFGSHVKHTATIQAVSYTHLRAHET